MSRGSRVSFVRWLSVAADFYSEFSILALRLFTALVRGRFLRFTAREKCIITPRLSAQVSPHGRRCPLPCGLRCSTSRCRIHRVPASAVLISTQLVSPSSAPPVSRMISAHGCPPTTTSTPPRPPRPSGLPLVSAFAGCTRAHPTASHCDCLLSRSSPANCLPRRLPPGRPPLRRRGLGDSCAHMTSSALIWTGDTWVRATRPLPCSP